MLPAPNRLRSYRILLTLIAVGNLAFAGAHRLDGGILYDPVWLRLAVSALALTFAAATYVRALQPYGRAMVYGTANLLVLCATVLWVANEYSTPYTVAYVGLVAALGLGGATTTRSWGAMTVMMVTAVLVPLLALVFLAPAGVGRASFVMSLFLTTTVAVVTARERARSQARVRAERKRYRNVFEGATDGMYLADATTRRVLDANPAMLRLTGYSLGEICALRIDDLLYIEPGEPSLDGNIAAARTNVKSVIVPRRIRKASGALVEVEVGGTVVDLNGRDTMSLIVRDATERRATERALLAAATEADAAREQAEELLRLKSSFLSSMSHEIRTPLTGILGYTELLGDEVSGDAREMLDAVERGATRLMRTLNSVLEIARLDAEQGLVLTEPVDLVAEAHAATNALQTVAAARGLSLSVEADALVWAEADAGSLVRILDNLIGNALKFTASGGVSVRVVRLGDRAELSVSDTGPGISEAFLPHLFDEFRQASNGHARTHEGSGLGLALARRLTERLGGTISAESTEGIGSTFTVSLPSAEARACAAVEA